MQYKDKYKPLLNSYKVDTDDFDKFLYDFRDIVITVDDISPFYYGIPKKADKGFIYTDPDRTEIVCRSHNYLSFKNIPLDSKDWENIHYWSQMRLVREYDSENSREDERINESLRKDTHLNKSINGSTAYRKVLSLLLKYYTREELDDCMAAHSVKYNEELAQVHYMIEPYYHSLFDDVLNIHDGTIYRFKNCYYYDINGAHNSALCEIFPRAAKEIEELYNQRHDHPEIKLYFNYFVGMLNSAKNKSKYGGTYNWIVQRTTRMLTNKIEHIGGNLIYANTDGFIAQNPDNIDEGSHKLGEFKLEYAGDVYLCRTPHYWLIQSNSLKGSIPLEVRDRLNIDLSTGEIPVYDSKIVSGVGYDGQEFACRVNSNFRLEKRGIKIYEESN